MRRLDNSDEANFNLSPISYEMLYKYLCEISPSKACGVDGITARLIKACGDAIIDPLLYIMNLSISKCVFPTAWKEAKVTPLYKSGPSTDPSNYRPISVLPIFSKVLERVIHDQLYDYVNGSGLLCGRQSGFRKTHSTSTCLVEFLDVVYNNIEKGNMSGVVFLDLKKVFDTVDHEILCCKLTSLGLSNSSTAWFENYLSGRTQVTKIGNHLSDPGQVSCGVPQGSILGPLLFIIYINSLPNVIDNCETFLYADDTAIIATGSSDAEITDKLNNAMHSASTWLDNNKLSLNTGKTKCMFIGTSNKLSKANFSNIECKGEVIGRVDSFKYLGLVLDSMLNFDKHTSYIKKSFLR